MTKRKLEILLGVEDEVQDGSVKIVVYELVGYRVYENVAALSIATVEEVAADVTASLDGLDA